MFNSDAFAGQVDMTTKGEWVAYTGSDEQIAEIFAAEHGFVLSNCDGTQSLMIKSYPINVMGKFTHYWIIPDDPLREMKIRQARTGQPVWVKEREMKKTGFPLGYKYYATTTPDWNIPNAEYSFTAFKE